jgi:hypothetical protein
MQSVMKPSVAAVLAVALAVPSLAAAQEGSRQTASLLFDERRPGVSTGSKLAVDYVNPADPQAKPPAVQKVVIALAPGTVIDTTVPELCTASNADLMSRGPAACPPGSRVGGGQIDLDTGTPGPGRVLANDVTMLNNRGELILLLESKSEPRSRIVARTTVEGGTITSEVSPVPGGPPDGFTAIKRVRLNLEPRSVEGERGYVTTPPVCPSEGVWTNTVTFTYRDGVSQTLRDLSPCAESGTAAPDGEAPRVRLERRPRRGCVGRAVRARVEIAEAGSGLARAELWLDGRRLLTTEAERFTRRVRVPGGGRHRLTVVAVDNAGNRSVERVRFRRCRR